eukprot:5684119-Karenia_brevis.AAC.1
MISAEAHNDFRLKLGVNNTDIWKKAYPTGGDAVFKDWWNKVFRTRTIGAWKTLLINCSDGAIDEDMVQGTACKESLAAWLIDQDFIDVHKVKPSALAGVGA